LKVNESETLTDKYEKLLLIGLEKIQKIATNENVNQRIVGLRKLRDKNDKDMIRSFFHYVLSNMVSKSNWMISRATERGGLIFSICDEGLALLMMMNNWEVWEEMSSGKERTRGELLNTMFTNSRVESNDPNVTIKVIKGWSGKGMKEFNKIMTYLVNVRNEEHVIEMEKELMQEYKELDMGKTGKRKRDGNDQFLLEDRVTPFDAYNIGFQQV